MFKKSNTIFNNKGAVSLLVKMGLFILVLVILDKSLGYVFEKAYARQKTGWEFRTRYAMEEVAADVLIFGGSRAEHQYDPDIFEERFGLSSYNAGRDDQSLLYHYAVFKAIIKKHVPKVVILDFENGLLRKNPKHYEDLSTLLPYYKAHPEIRPIIELRSPFERIKLLSTLYPYNSLLFNIAAGNANFKKNEHNYKKGFLPINGSIPAQPQVIEHIEKYEFDDNKIAFLGGFIENCKRLSIKLVIVNSPAYYKSKVPDQSMLVVQNLAKKNNIQLIDFSNDSDFVDPNLFGHPFHVNAVGAEIFTKKVINAIGKE